jgi:hypothetical protein
VAAKSRSAVRHDDGVVLGAADRLHALAGPRAALVHVLGDRRRPDERHRGDVRVVEQRVDRHLVPVDDVEHAVRQPGLVVELGDDVRHRGVPLGRLEHERVAGGDRHRVHPHRDHDREVERRDPRTDAERLAERERVDVGRDLIGVLALGQLRDPAGVLDDLHAADDLALGVVENLAVLRGDDPRKLVHVALHEVAELDT